MKFHSFSYFALARAPIARVCRRNSARRFFLSATEAPAGFYAQPCRTANLNCWRPEQIQFRLHISREHGISSSIRRFRSAQAFARALYNQIHVPFIIGTAYHVHCFHWNFHSFHIDCGVVFALAIVCQCYWLLVGQHVYQYTIEISIGIIYRNDDKCAYNACRKSRIRANGCRRLATVYTAPHAYKMNGE